MKIKNVTSNYKLINKFTWLAKSQKLLPKLLFLNNKEQYKEIKTMPQLKLSEDQV